MTTTTIAKTAADVFLATIAEEDTREYLLDKYGQGAFYLLFNTIDEARTFIDAPTLENALYHDEKAVEVSFGDIAFGAVSRGVAVVIVDIMNENIRIVKREGKEANCEHITLTPLEITAELIPDEISDEQIAHVTDCIVANEKRPTGRTMYYVADDDDIECIGETDFTDFVTTLPNESKSLSIRTIERLWLEHDATTHVVVLSSLRREEYGTDDMWLMPLDTFQLTTSPPSDEH